MEQKMLEKIKKTAINSAFVVGATETKEKKYNDYEEKEKDFFALGEKLAKDIFVEQVLAETNYNKNELKEFILENKDVFKTGDEELKNLSYKDMVKIVKNSSNEIIDFKNDVEPLFERAFAYSEENTINECKQDYFESLGRKKLLPMLLKKVEENVEHFKDIKGFMINDVDNEFGREDDYYQFRDKLMKDVSNEFYDTFVTSVYNLDYKTDREDKKEEKDKLIEFFGVNPLLADDFFKFSSSNKVDLGFENKTSYSGTIYQANGENYFNINLKDKSNKNEININAKALNELKEIVIDFVEKDIEDDKTNSEYIQKRRKENLEKLKELDLKDVKIETDKNFSFEFTNKNRDNDKYSYLLIMETEKAKHLTVNFGNDKFKNIAYALTDKNYSEVFYKEHLSYGSFSYDKIDYLKEKNVDIIEKVDKNKQKETLQEIKADIIMSAMEVNGRRQYLEENEDDYVTRFLKGIDECFEDRIGTLKDKAEFLEKRHEELGLTLNEDGKIEELYSPNESEYKDNVNAFLSYIKTDIKEEIGNRFDFDLSEEINNIDKKLGKEHFENAKENLYKNERKKAIDLIKKEYLPIRPQTMSLQKEFLRNAIPILLSEDKMGLTKKEIENLKNISDDKKEELKDRINNYFNSYSEQAKDTKNDFTFKWNINNFHLSDYDSYSKELDIKIPKVKSVKKEINKEKEVEKGREVDF